MGVLAVPGVLRQRGPPSPARASCTRPNPRWLCRRRPRRVATTAGGRRWTCYYILSILKYYCPWLVEPALPLFGVGREAAQLYSIVLMSRRVAGGMQCSGAPGWPSWKARRALPEGWRSSTLAGCDGEFVAEQRGAVTPVWQNLAADQLMPIAKKNFFAPRKAKTFLRLALSPKYTYEN